MAVVTVMVDASSGGAMPNLATGKDFERTGGAVKSASGGALPLRVPNMASRYRHGGAGSPYSGSMKTGDIYRHPGHLIRRAQQIAVSIFTEDCRPHGVTPVQYAILYTVKNNPGLDQISLANLVALDRSNTGDVVSRLEERGLLRRTSGAPDRRTKRLHLTDAGAALLEAMMPAVEASQQRILAPLDAGERQSFMTLLGKLVDINNTLSRAPQRPKVSRRVSGGVRHQRVK
jgi:DNA-binding MarR family transcriptional regulator